MEPGRSHGTASVVATPGVDTGFVVHGDAVHRGDYFADGRRFHDWVAIRCGRPGFGTLGAPSSLLAVVLWTRRQLFASREQVT